MIRFAPAALALAVLAAPLSVLAAPSRTATGPSHRATVRIEGGGHLRIPFELQNGLVWMRGVVGRSDSVWIAVDTGAAASVMDDGLAKSLGLEQHGRHESHGAGGMQPSAMVSDVTIRIGDLSIHREEIATIDFGAISAQAAHPLQVVVGHELFEACVVRFDYPAGVMDVWDAEHAPRDLAGTVLPLTFEHNHPYIEGELKLPGRPPLRGRFVIDTGSAAGVIVPNELVARDSLALAFPRTLEVVARGVGGEIRSRVARAESFTLGKLRFDKPVVFLQGETRGRISAPGTIGNFGGQLASRCRVTFDYRRKRVAFEPGDGFDRPFEADMSGIAWARGADGWTVRIVNPDTPASEAGLREGDVVTRVDDDPAAAIVPGAMRLRMQREGRSVRLEIRRGTETRTATLVLRRLI